MQGVRRARDAGARAGKRGGEIPSGGGSDVLLQIHARHKSSDFAGALRAQQRHGSGEYYRFLHAMGWMEEGVVLPSSP